MIKMTSSDNGDISTDESSTESKVEVKHVEKFLCHFSTGY